jgi:flagellar transcriptional activator FlhC
MLPFSTDWFMTWQPNIHSSLFYSIYRFMRQEARCNPIQSIVKSYRLYVEHVDLSEDEAVLTLTRAWTLVRFFDSGLLTTAPCTRCGGHFVAHAHDPQQSFVCGLCAPPSRAGKTRKAAVALAVSMSLFHLARVIRKTGSFRTGRECSKMRLASGRSALCR